MNFRTRKMALAVSVAALSFAPLVASAGNSDVITINATVNGVCKFQATTGSFTVSNSGAVIDPSSATGATGNVNFKYNCTKGQAPGFQYAVGAGALGAPVPASVVLSCTVANCPSGADTMTAALTWTLPAVTTGAGFSAAGDKTINLKADIAQAGFQDAAVGGPYTNTVTIAITP